MYNPRERRKEKRRVRRNNSEHWYHHIFDFIADCLWFGVDIPWFIIRGVFQVLFHVLKGIGRGLLSVLEALGDIFSIFT